MEGSEASGATQALFVVISSFVVMVMLTMIIAIMGDTFARVKTEEEVHFFEEFADLVYELEGQWRRKQKVDRLRQAQARNVVAGLGFAAPPESRDEERRALVFPTYILFSKRVLRGEQASSHLPMPFGQGKKRTHPPIPWE